MRRLLLAGSFCTIFLMPIYTVHAQVVMTRDNYPREGAFTDSVYRSRPANIPTPAEGPDQIWDYSALQIEALLQDEYLDAQNDPGFPGALNSHQANLTFQGLLINSRAYHGLDDDGWHVLGRNFEGNAYSIAPITGGANDTLNFPEATVLLRGRSDFLKFPLTYNDQWTDTYVEITPYELTVAAFGLNRVPGSLERFITQNRSVVGFGKLILPDPDGGSTAPMDVLMMKVVLEATDSVFLGGQLAPPPLMAAFNLTQGSTFADSFYVFYKPDFHSNVLNLDINDRIAFFRPQADRTISNVHSLRSINSSTFPNPVEQGQIVQIALDMPVENSVVELYDIQGRKVWNKNIGPDESSLIRVNIPDHANVGLYLYQIRDHQGQFISTGKIQVSSR